MVNAVVPTTDPVAGVEVAVIVIEVPPVVARRFARPMVVVLNVTSAVLLDVQVTALVISSTDPSE